MSLFGDTKRGAGYAEAGDDDAERSLILSSVRQLMLRFGDDYWLGLDKERKYPDEFVREIGKAGLAAVVLPREYGGAGYGTGMASLILEEINAMGGNAQPFHGQFYLSFVVSRRGSPDLKEKYLPRLAAGELRMQTFALTEPEAGSESTRIKTSAVRDGDGYVIDGHKTYISRIGQTDLMVLAARTTPYERAERKTDGISLFLVDLAEAKGLQWHRIETMFNSQTYEVFIDHLVVPRGNLLGEEGKGFTYLLEILNPERILLASECIGDSRWFIEKSVGHARDRVVFGRPIGANQGIQFPIAEVYAKLLAAEKVRTAAAELYDSGADGKTVGEYANISKYLASECSWQAANVAMDVYGGGGLAVANHIERKFRETRLYRVAPISQNLALAYIAHNVLGLPRSY